MTHKYNQSSTIQFQRERILIPQESESDLSSALSSTLSTESLVVSDEAGGTP